MQADLYFSFRSPYSYLGAARYRQLTQEWDLQIRLRPVYPVAIRNPGFFKAVNPMWVDYLMKDVQRVAEYTGQPFRWPRPDPVVVDRETMTFPDEQPYIHRLTWLGVAAARRDLGLEFAVEVSNYLWGEGVEDWPSSLDVPVTRAGLDLSELEAEVDADPDGFDAEVSANQDAEEACGHWGTPCLVVDGEPFFGQDRIDMAVWRMQQKGMVRR
ncbi:MAG: DsbA family protein [Pseudomonadota bacterium]